MRHLFRSLTLTLCLALLPASAGLAVQETEWDQLPEEIRPGKSVRLSFSAPEDTARVELAPAGLIRDQVSVSDGSGSLWWDGTIDGEPLEPGTYQLTVTSGDASDTAEIQIGTEAPSAELLECGEVLGDGWTAELMLNMPGTLSIFAVQQDTRLKLAELIADEGDMLIHAAQLDGLDQLTSGSWSLEFILTDESGFSSNAESIDYDIDPPELAHDISYHLPNERSLSVCDHDLCFWKMNMGEMDEDAIWEVLTQPVIVLEGSERNQVKLRAQPDASCTDYVGEVTCRSQAVHVLECQEEWSRIEAYSSSEEGSRVAVFAEPVEGWVKTSLLVEKAVSQTYGIVIDKLQQRLYLFKEGKLYATLLCSTGYPRAETPFNETPAGEFIIVSWTGGFWSNNLFCDYALRINDGILLHEVPCTITLLEDGTEKRDYYRCEQYLGEKASHGCIRIQRALNPQGVNMKWLWDNLNKKENTKVIIWDEIGRVLGYPDDRLTLYYNPKGGKMYHSVADCPAVKSEYLPLSPFLYGELEEEGFAELTPCPACAPQLRHSAIDTINRKNDRVSLR